MKVIPIFLLLLIVYGCSYREVYEGIQASNQNDCARLPASQYDECMEKANKSYEEYERERKEALDK